MPFVKFMKIVGTTHLPAAPFPCLGYLDYQATFWYNPYLPHFPPYLPATSTTRIPNVLIAPLSHPQAILSGSNNNAHYCTIRMHNSQCR